MKISLRRFVVVNILFLFTIFYMNVHHEKPQPLQLPLSQFPLLVGEWSAMRNEVFSQPLLDVLRPNDYMARRYIGPNNQAVELYVGYHDRAQGSGPIHSPKNCLPGSGWIEVASAPMEVKVGTTQVNLRQSVYSLGEQSELFLYCFMVREKIVSSEYALKLAEIENSMRYGQSGSSFIRISLPVGRDVAQASQTALSFFLQAYPYIQTFLSVK